MLNASIVMPVSCNKVNSPKKYVAFSIIELECFIK